MIKIFKLRLLVFLLFYIQGDGMYVLLNPWEIFAKELFFNRIPVHSPQMQQKRSSLQIVFKTFACF